MADLSKLDTTDIKLVTVVTSDLKSITQSQIAKVMGWKEPKTVREHLNKPEVQEAIKAVLDEKLSGLRPIAYKSLEYGLIQKEKWATELFFKLNGEMVERKEVSGPGGKPIETEISVGESMSEDDIKRIAKSILKEK
jgi:hypothetical protein